MACPALHACARVSAEERPWRGQRDACALVGVVRIRLRTHARSVLVRAEQLHDAATDMKTQAEKRLKELKGKGRAT
jgi:hypothetical protein